MSASRRGFLALCGGVTVGCKRDGAVRVRVGIAAQQSLSQIPVYLAERLGYFKESGLEIELSEFPGASKGMEALLGGSLDVLSGYYSQVLQVRVQQRAFDAFLCLYDSHLVALAVSPKSEGKIKRIDDLRGTKVGVTTLGSATHQFLNFLLRRTGVKEDDVSPIAIGTAGRAAAAMERSMVDAGVVTDFTIRYLERRFGHVRLLADTRTREGTKAAHGVDAFPGTVLIGATDWLDAHQDAARRVSEAVWRAVNWMKRNGADKVVEQMPASHYGEDKEAYLTAVRYAIPMLNASGVISPQGHASAVAFIGAADSMPSAMRTDLLPSVR